MSDLICRKTMQRCLHPGMCSPHGGCRPDKSEWQSGYDEGRRMGVKAALDERDQLKAENEALRKDLESHKRMLLAAACDIGAIGEALGADMDDDGDAIKGLAIELRQDKKRLDWLDGKSNPVVGGQTASDPEGEIVAIRWIIDGCCNTVREAIDYEVEHG